ncbi:MAG: ABC transporter permease [Alphaproteobacteria bacterium]
MTTLPQTQTGQARSRPNTLGILALVLALLLAIPLVVVCASVLQGPSSTFAHIAATLMPVYMLNTVALGLIVVLGVLILGVPPAWLVSTCIFPGRRFLEAALVLPLAAPAYVLAYAYTDLLDSYGPVQSALRSAFGWETGEYWFPEIRSLPGAALMLILVLYPYVFLLARARFLTESATMLDAARLLGRGRWHAFFSVSLKLARPAIVAGAALAMMEAFADYGTVAYFGVPVFSTGIYRAWFSFADPVSAAQLAAFLIGLVAIALCAERLFRGDARYHETGRGDRRPSPVKLNPAQSYGAIALCGLPPLFGFFIPALSLLLLVIDAGASAREFWRDLGNTLFVAGVAAAMVTLIAAILAFVRHNYANKITARAADLVGLGYAAPGAVIAVGILIPLSFADNAVDALFRAQFGVSTGLLLTGSIFALIFAYAVRFSAVALHGTSAGLERITPSIGGAARMLSRSSWDALIRVYTPMLAPSALTAALIVFVDVMKELPATLILRPFNFDTLAVAAYNYAADERLGFAALPSLAIVAAGIVPCLLLIRGITAAARGREAPPVPLP